MFSFFNRDAALVKNYVECIENVLYHISKKDVSAFELAIALDKWKWAETSLIAANYISLSLRQFKDAKDWCNDITNVIRKRQQDETSFLYSREYIEFFDLSLQTHLSKITKSLIK